MAASVSALNDFDLVSPALTFTSVPLQAYLIVFVKVSRELSNHVTLNDPNL